MKSSRRQRRGTSSLATSGERSMQTTTTDAVEHGDFQGITSMTRRKIATSSAICGTTYLSDSCWAPSTFTAFRALLSARLCAAVWSLIADCDETFNYWEPTHFLIYGNGDDVVDGSGGFQTWEYSPTYALRSYLYLLVNALPGCIYAHVLHADKVMVFCFIRCHLGLVATACESYFYKSVRERFGGRVARTMLAFLLFASGMFVSSAAYLPSTFSMYFTMLAIAAWLLGKHAVSILCVAVSTFVGWPFASILGIGIAVDIIVWHRRIKYFIVWSIVSLLVVLVPLVMVDSHYYGKMVLTPLNIVLYNVLSGKGPELYGTEPFSFYFVNGFLNFNFVFIAALAVAPLMVVDCFYMKHSGQVQGLAWLTILPMYVWIVIFFSQAHKEERFLFPIYPFFCFAAAYACVTAETIAAHFTTKKWNLFVSNLHVAFVVVCTILAISRSLALYRNYRAPFEVFMEVNRIEHQMKPHSKVNLCIGKEWYRYPSSFFLPNTWSLHFIQSEFKGQLPKQYSRADNATAIIPDNMNDENLEEPSRYMDIGNCHYLIDLDVAMESPLQPRYSRMLEEWEVGFAVDFLELDKSPSPWRAFYVPYLTENMCSYAKYVLLKSKKNKVKLRKNKSKLAY